MPERHSRSCPQALADDRLRVGCAGWGMISSMVPGDDAPGSQLQRYASVLDMVEINSSFKAEHRPDTYGRWAEDTPERFRFSVKLPRAISHEAELRDAGEALGGFVDAASELGGKLAAYLVQLPPGLAFDADVADAFFECFRALSEAPIVLEPRHQSWFGAAAAALMDGHRVDRVIADPKPEDAAWGAPADAARLAYFRLHGKPKMYFSDYGADALDDWAGRILDAHRACGRAVCILDNTAAGEALPDALDLCRRLSARRD